MVKCALLPGRGPRGGKVEVIISGGAGYQLRLERARIRVKLCLVQPYTPLGELIT
jgi:hypothetical protein